MTLTLWIAVAGIASAIFGYLYNGSLERKRRSAEQRSKDYASFLELFVRSTLKRQSGQFGTSLEDDLGVSRIQLLLSGSKPVVAALRQLVERTSEKGKSTVSIQDELLALLKSMRKDYGQRAIDEQDALWIIQNEKPA